MKIALHYMAACNGDVLKARDAAEADNNFAALTQLEDMDQAMNQYNRYLISAGTSDRIRNLHKIAMGSTSAAVQACKLLLQLETELRNANQDDEEIAKFLEEMGIIA